MIDIRKGTLADMEAFIQLLTDVKSAMEHKEWFSLDPPEEVRRMMKDGIMELWVAVDGEKLAGAFDVLYPGTEPFNYGYALGYSAEQLAMVVNMDSAAVHPAYRGLGLQKKLMQIAEQEIAQKGKRILLCTVHPENRYSLQNVLSQGYSIEKTLPMYGSVRHVLKKEIEKRY